MKQILLIILLPCFLGGCAAATPLLATQAGSHFVARSDEDRKVLIAAALEEEPNLLTYSVESIASSETKKAEQTYLTGYNNPKYSDNMKALSLYQIALMYMNQFNKQRNDEVAEGYLNKIKRKFPQSPLSQKAQEELDVIKKRRQNGLKVGATELLGQVNRQALLAQDNKTFDSELLPMSERAIRTDHFANAKATYQILYQNTSSSKKLRAQALYQIGLMLMSPYNKESNKGEAISVFRKIINEFPELLVSRRANQKINQIINNQ